MSSAVLRARALALGCPLLRRGLRAAVLSTVTCVLLRLSGPPGSPGSQCGSPCRGRGGSPSYPHGVGAAAAGTGVTGAPASTLSTGTLPSAAHSCETPLDLRFCLDFQVNRENRGITVGKSADQHWSQPCRPPGHRHVIPATSGHGKSWCVRLHFVPENGKITVFLLDDHEVVRRGVHELLSVEDDIEVVGEAGTAADALVRIPATRPDVAVLDVRLPDGSGVEVCREIRSQDETIKCLMLTSFADDEALFDAIMAGASGYVLKAIRGNELLAAVRGRGGRQVAARPGGHRPGAGAAARRRTTPRATTSSPGLTEQERKILDLIGEGLTNRVDRRAAAPRREDDQELRLQPALQAGHGAALAGRRLRGADPGRAAPLTPLREPPPAQASAHSGMPATGRAEVPCCAPCPTADHGT